MPLPDPPTIVRTLVLDGFHLESATRSAGHLILRVHRYDRFGVSIPYSFAFFNEGADEAAVEGLLRAAEFERRHPVVVASEAPSAVTHVDAGRFFSIVGGTVDDSFIRAPDIVRQMDDLGHGRLPSGVAGDAELALERNIAVCLQFLTGHRARHWGGDRRFEKLPDGVVPGEFVLLYDGKAYENAYSVSADDIRRFASYVADFNSRYSPHLGSVFAFVVVAGKFTEESDHRQRRSGELYATCKTPLCFVTAHDLGSMVQVTRNAPQLRKSVDWRRVFAGPTATPNLVQAELRRVEKDALIRDD